MVSAKHPDYKHVEVWRGPDLLASPITGSQSIKFIFWSYVKEKFPITDTAMNVLVRVSEAEATVCSLMTLSLPHITQRRMIRLLMNNEF
jgi:hypothetical protein